MPSSTVPAPGFPINAGLRARNELLMELAEYVGGEDAPEQIERARKALFGAVRKFNSVPWRFNRVTQDIALTTSTETFTLATDFRNPRRAHLLDSSGRVQRDVRWIEPSEWLTVYTQGTTTGPAPLNYTAQNAHETGLVTVYPKTGTTLTYPTMRLFYNRRIVHPTGATDRLNVPEEVEQAIFEDAVDKILNKVRSFITAGKTHSIAEFEFARIAREWQDHPEIEVF